MNIFISWSGTLSLEVAKLLKQWIKCVLQATNPWVSSDDIERGALWFNDISNSLKDCNIGIVCLTRSNIKSPWILFEAGGLLKGLTTNRVCTFLVDLEPKDINAPLSHFNHTASSKEDVYKLISTLNDKLEDRKLDKETLDNVFHTYWPKFEAEFNKITHEIVEDNEVNNPRSEADILTEILYTVRGLDTRLNSLENYGVYNYPIVEFSDPIFTHREKLEIKQDKVLYSPLFKKGDLVKHKIFGSGSVTNSHNYGNDAVLEVQFDSGEIKRLMESTLIEKNLL